MVRTFIAVAIVFSCLAVQAQDATTQPKSLAARQAETKFNLDMQKLDAEYQQKAAAIKQAYVDGLKTALKTLAKSDNADPDEIARLSAKIKEVQATVVRPVALDTQPKTITGKWKLFVKGKLECIRDYNSNGTVSQYAPNGTPADNNGKWAQTERDVVIHFAGGWERFLVSSDGKRMSGGNDNGTYITEEMMEH